MRKVIAFIIVLAVSNTAFAQQDSKSDTTQNNSVNKKSSTLHYQVILETGYSWGLGEWGQSVFRFNGIFGIRLPHYSIGLGSGFSTLHNKSTGDYKTMVDTMMRFKYQVPVFLDQRIYFSNKRIRPYLAFGIGMSILNWEMISDISLFINSSTGIFWKISDKVSLIIGIAFESYNIKYDVKEYNPPYYLTTTFEEKSNALGLNIGVSF